jgi:predicted P-loop ATPase
MTISIEELKNLPIWVNWKSEERDGKKTKIPYNPRTGGKAQSNNPDTWVDFNFAQSKADNYSGIGFMFANGICGIDIDNKTGNPELDKQAETIINLMDTYTERSPSGTGWHIIFKCDMSKIPTIDGKLDGKYYYKNPHNDLECYFPGLTNRYFTYTEQGNGKNIEERTEQVLIFIENYMLKVNFKAKNGRQERLEISQPYQISTDILEKARKSKNGVKFSTLYDRGDTSDYNNDDSSADLALCSMLAWWLQGDFNEIDSYFRQSALYRDKWERKDYSTNTINKAIDNCNGKYYTPPGRPKSKKEKIIKEFSPEQEQLIKNIKDKFGVMDDEKLTISGVAFHLEQIGVSVKYNETIREAEIIGLHNYNNNYIIDNFPVVLYNDLNLQYKKCTISIVQDFLRVIMMNNAYNPVLEIFEGKKWDKTDRLPELYRIMRIDDSDKLSKTLIYKWLWQNLSLARNEKGEYGADGILVLKGGQAAGKTTFARKTALKIEWFGEGLLLDVRQTDTIIRAVSCWIGELGEIESTFKSDINALKAFITLPKDNYRVPYGRIADKLPRRTSFIGTCNSDEYLIDETGNRRYWTVPINERMDLEALEKFDMLQLYLQIDEEAKINIQGFRLTPEEITELSERNGHHEKSMKGEQEIKDILFKAERDNLTFKEMTVTEFKELYPVLRIYAANRISAVLKKNGIIIEIKKKDGKTQKLANLPFPKSSY